MKQWYRYWNLVLFAVIPALEPESISGLNF